MQKHLSDSSGHLEQTAATPKNTHLHQRRQMSTQPSQDFSSLYPGMEQDTATQLTIAFVLAQFPFAFLT